MDAQRICKNCQQPLPADAPEGLCPVCLAKAGAGTELVTLGTTVNVNPVAEAATGGRVPPDPAQLAAQFPQLEIIELLGMGGMGMVYKARQSRLDRFVALKILPLASASHPSFAERFNREAKALAKLNHPGIVAVYDFGQTDQYYYFVMEYVDGMNLRRLLNTQSVTPRQALELVVQICTALQYAHDEGVVHRDIKPENILINKKGQVKIADFGLAKLLGSASDTALTMSQAAMGTLNYMAPEQRQNAQKVDHRADIYSLGVVFYEMLTGEVPMGRFDAPSKKVQIDVRLDEVVLRALEREPARRYQQASEVKTGVETIASSMPREKQSAGAAGAFEPKPRPQFASYVLKRFGIFGLVWLGVALGLYWTHLNATVLDAPLNAAIVSQAQYFIPLPIVLFCGTTLLLFSVGWAKFVLPASFVLTVYSWLDAREKRGLTMRQLSPPIRSGLLAWSAVILAVYIACLIVTLWLSFNVAYVSGSWERGYRTRQWESAEWWFLPASGAFEKLGLRASFTSAGQNGKGILESQPACTVSLVVHRKDLGPAVMKVVVPGLRATYRVPLTNSWDNTSILDKDTLIYWLQKGAGLEPSAPKFQEEASEIYALLKQYENEAPQTVMEFVNLAKAELREFSFGGFATGAFSYYGSTFELLGLGTLIVVECILYLGFQLWRVRHSYGAAWAEIADGRWNPPPRPPPRTAIRRYLLKASVGTLMLLLFLSLGLVVCFRENALASAAVVALVALVILLSFLQQLYTRTKIQSARERGLWPQPGEIPTIEHVRRLAQAREEVLAIKLYRQICHVSLKDAKEIVEGLGELRLKSLSRRSTRSTAD